MGSLQREEKDFVKVLEPVSEGGDWWWWCGVAGLPQRRSGWAGGLLSGGDEGGRRGVVREPGR